MDKVREEFEVWACNYNLKIADWGNYADRHVNNMWKAWRASRAALCVELPDMPQGKYLSQYDEGFSDCLSIVITVLEDAEVSYK